MDIEKEIENIVFENVDKEKFKVFLFGSRAKGDFRKTSDYDIGILGEKKLDFEIYLKIIGELNELPYRVDFVDFNRASLDFKKIALKHTKPWN